LHKIRATLEYLGVFDSEKEGSLRVDANVSIQGGERVEVKNITSYKGVEKALTFEVTRQRGVIRRGQRVTRETRHFVEARGVTTSSRSKEEEQDYRYFPEPDLRPMRVRDWSDAIVLPELPDARRTRFITQYGCSPEHARTLTGELRIAEFFEQVADPGAPATATWVADTLIGELNYREMSVSSVPSSYFRELMQALSKGEVTDHCAVEVLRSLLDQLHAKGTCESPLACVARLGLGKAGEEIAATVAAEVICENERAVADYHSGKNEAFNFLIGQVMRKTKGRADPAALNRALKEALDMRGE
jgi:aspartyl-tRNA(Asn)/glutamyl-tRNA(Gln) amidotransferase subunit B